ncbi:MAG: hypothetical protein PF795_05030 [Kiritimatiellae bacterium]|nr:hypothetical protein [Kiritimatiellia bacterium]
MNIFLTGIPGLMISLRLCAGDVEMFVRQLGAETYPEREVASTRLWEIGTPALDAVRRAAASDDPEVRMRANEVLPFLERGVRPGFSEALQAEMLQSDGVSGDKIKQLITRIIEAHNVEVLPFLAYHLNGKHRNLALSTLDQLLAAYPIEGDLIALLNNPPLDRKEENVLREALLKSSTAQDLHTALGLENLSASQRKDIIDWALELLLDSFNAKEFSNLVVHAERFWKREPNDARFLYLLAFGKHSAESPEAATPYLMKIKVLNPEDEVAHYEAGRFLLQFSKNVRTFAEFEFLMVLELSPDESVYDMKSYLQLAELNQNKEDYFRAAEYMEKSLRIYRAQKRAGLNVRLTGGDEAGLEAEIKALELKASTAIFGKQPIRIHYLPLVKDDKEKAYYEAVNTTSGRMRFDAKPKGEEGIEIGLLMLNYDEDTGKMKMTFDGEVVHDDLAFTFKKQGPRRLLLQCRDMRYIFEMDPQSGEGTIIATFELDYRCTVIISGEMRNLDQLTIRLNGVVLSPEDLDEQIAFDVLPEKLEFLLEAKTREGHGAGLKYTIDPQDGMPVYP